MYAKNRTQWAMVLVEVVSVNNYSEQYIYEITPQGDEHFKALMAKYSLQTDDIQDLRYCKVDDE
ncbi:hypothetical protein [Paenibacillus sp. FSL R7-0333]|uniref:hypothetical protein n=1 Tax=Paenibacillus sp. FSL R7-0333 TaxID=1926587 RepID=UPI0011816EC5